MITTENKTGSLGGPFTSKRGHDQIFRKIRGPLFFLFIFLFSLVISLKLHSGKHAFSWESGIWADRAGYYVYLPATFLYRFNASEFPKDMDAKTGYGFYLDKKQNTVVTQYYYGESLLLTPFFLAAHFIQRVFHLDEAGGFSLFYSCTMNIAAMVYLLLGLLFLFQFLRRSFRPGVVYLILSVVFLGTNLFFYTVEDALMSHVYSFFAVSAFLFAMKAFLDNRDKYRYFLLMVLFFSLMVIIRPTNAIAAICFLFWDIRSFKEMQHRLRLALIPRYILPFLLILFVLFLPQSLYWKYAHGSYIYLKYGVEFSNWNHPRLMEVWFSTLNGLFIYSPLVIFFIFGAGYMIFQKKLNGAVAVLIFLIVSYIAASYKFWYYGCSFGHRAFVEFYPILCVPAAYLAEWVFLCSGRVIKFLISLLILFLLYVNIGLTVFGDKCNNGSIWDWDQFNRELYKTGIIPASLKSNDFNNDFENEQISRACPVTDSVFHSRNNCEVIHPDDRGCRLYTSFLRDLKQPGAIKLNVSFWMLGKPADSGNVVLSAGIKKEDQVLYNQEFLIDPGLGRNKEWCRFQQEIMIPPVFDRDATLQLDIYNRGIRNIFLDDLRVKF
jgi:hypothetical protein